MVRCFTHLVWQVSWCRQLTIQLDVWETFEMRRFKNGMIQIVSGRLGETWLVVMLCLFMNDIFYFNNLECGLNVFEARFQSRTILVIDKKHICCLTMFSQTTGSSRLHSSVRLDQIKTFGSVHQFISWVLESHIPRVPKVHKLFKYFTYKSSGPRSCSNYDVLCRFQLVSICDDSKTDRTRSLSAFERFSNSY